MASEFDLIARYFSRPAPAGMLGVGDDCALFAPAAGMQVATSTDLLIEGRHFLPDTDPRALGHKALAVNLSDLAAMGARPRACLLGLAIPHADEAWLAAFAEGFHALADLHGCPLIGGDTTRSDHGIVISITVFGDVAADRALRRDAGRPGDDLWVSGALGAAPVALDLIRARVRDERLALLRDALERPQPRVALGQALAGLAHAAVDISDGLLQDLGHILKASHCGARIEYAALPVHEALRGLPQERIVQAVLGGGDAYELCFSAAPADRGQVIERARRAGTPVARIGELVGAAQGLQVLDGAGRPLDALPGGFDHFRGEA